MRALSFVVLGLVSFGCASVPEIEEKGSSSSHLNAQAEALWPTSAGGTARIPVCWTAPIQNPKQFGDPETPAPTADDLAVRKQWVRDIVAAQWNARTRVHFVGWKDCGSNASSMVRLTPMDSTIVEADYDAGQSHTQALGKFMLGKQAFLNLYFGDEFIYASRLVAQGKDRRVLMGGNRWNPAACMKEFFEPRADIDTGSILDDTLALYRSCLEFNIVHEFGHIAGFAHEQFRDDATEECIAGSGTTRSDIANVSADARGTLPLGPFDAESVMSYCRKNFSANLTDQDVDMTNTVYSGHVWSAGGQNGADGEDGQSY